MTDEMREQKTITRGRTRSTERGNDKAHFFFKIAGFACFKHQILMVGASEADSWSTWCLRFLSLWPTRPPSLLKQRARKKHIPHQNVSAHIWGRKKKKFSTHRKSNLGWEKFPFYRLFSLVNFYIKTRKPWKKIFFNKNNVFYSLRNCKSLLSPPFKSTIEQKKKKE